MKPRGGRNKFRPTGKEGRIQMDKKKESEQLVTAEPIVIDFDEFSRVDNTFREKYADITADLAAVLTKYGIEGYRVTGFIFQPPNPRNCRPYCRWVPGGGMFGGHIECGISCFNT